MGHGAAWRRRRVHRSTTRREQFRYHDGADQSEKRTLIGLGNYHYTKERVRCMYLQGTNEDEMTEYIQGICLKHVAGYS